ncbi:hypothetical protein [uncultured Xanthomonas sp.]|uniref:hypothetical protein n=1 Tax=uncultured Xanthomonas sp. TaxID=152831 RepID=UPI0025F6F363|nr:hypothetical protein [uncultured Xanthomonas sp.]
MDWTATAAWVQAVGSILAVGAAIWIGNRQHRQNVELVESERERVDARDRQRDLAVRNLAATAIAMLDQPLSALETLHRGAIDSAESGHRAALQDDEERLQGAFEHVHAMSEIVLAQFIELKQIYYAAGPVQGVSHYHITAALKDLSKAAKTAAQTLRNTYYGAAEATIFSLVENIVEARESINEDLGNL